MKAWLRSLRERRLRPWDLLLAVPIASLAGLMAATVEGAPVTWAILWAAISGGAIVAYLVIEWLISR